MPDPTFTAPPVAPQPTDSKAVFNSRAFSFFGWFGSFISEMAAAVPWFAGKASDASASATAAQASALAASDSETAASMSASASSVSASSSLTYAQASAAAVGIPPPVADRYLGTDGLGNPAWVPVPTDANKLNRVGGVATNFSVPYIDLGTVAASGTATANVGTATVQRVQAAGTLTIAFAGLPGGSVSTDLELLCVNFGGKTINWPAGNWIKPDGSFSATVGGSGVIWQTTGTDRVLVMIDNGAISYKVMR